MDKKILEAYNKLVPADQLVIDAMIVSLYKKDEQLHKVIMRWQEERERGGKR